MIIKKNIESKAITSLEEYLTKERKKTNRMDRIANGILCGIVGIVAGAVFASPTNLGVYFKDINKDGKKDAIITCSSSNYAFLWKADGEYSRKAWKNYKDSVETASDSIKTNINKYD